MDTLRTLASARLIEGSAEYRFKFYSKYNAWEEAAGVRLIDGVISMLNMGST